METVDLLVAGSGAGGLSSAVMAAHLGLKTLVIEKEPVYGGATAWSGGWMWIPRNPLGPRGRQATDEIVDALRCELRDGFDEDHVRTFVDAGAHMIEFFRANTAVQFINATGTPDFHTGSMVGANDGCMLCAEPYNAHDLGPRLAQLRRPLNLIAPWGMGIAGGHDLRQLLESGRSLSSFRYAVRRFGSHVRDLALHGRGMLLVGGNALVARLARSALVRGVELRVSTPLLRLTREGVRVTGAVVRRADGSEAQIRATHGVVLACGGGGHDAQRWRSLHARALHARPASVLPKSALPASARAPNAQASARAHQLTGPCVAPSGNTGDGLRLGESVGGHVSMAPGEALALAPISRVTGPDGQVQWFPHLYERVRPGIVAVLRNGQRFADEASDYHSFVQRMLDADAAVASPPCAWLVCDHRFLCRYGLGAVRPRPFRRGRHLRSGYLQRADTLEALATMCGIDVAGLQATVCHYNEAARRGMDPRLAPIVQAPFYAVQVSAGSLAALAGLAVDASARVLGSDSKPIDGLFACGDDMASIGGGRYPSGGLPLGTAMTFGFIAAHAAAGADWRDTGAHRVEIGRLVS